MERLVWTGSRTHDSNTYYLDWTSGGISFYGVDELRYGLVESWALFDTRIDFFSGMEFYTYDMMMLSYQDLAHPFVHSVGILKEYRFDPCGSTF